MIAEESQDPRDVFRGSAAFKEGTILGASFALNAVSISFSEIYIEGLTKLNKPAFVSALKAKASLFKNAFLSVSQRQVTDFDFTAAIDKIKEFESSLQQVQIKKEGWLSNVTRQLSKYSGSIRHDFSKKDLIETAAFNFINSINQINKSISKSFGSQLEQISYRELFSHFSNQLRSIERISNLLELLIQRLPHENGYVKTRESLIEINDFLNSQLDKARDWKKVFSVIPANDENSKLVTTALMALSENDLDKMQLERILETPESHKTEKEFFESLTFKGIEFATNLSKSIGKVDSEISTSRQANICHKVYGN
jgi:hypothetical protein